MAEIGYTHNIVKGAGKHPVLAAYVDNELKELGFAIYMAHSIEFLDITSPDGRRTYMRSLSFLLQKAVNDVYNNKYQLVIKYSLPNGLYGELRNISCCDNDIEKIKGRMQELARIIGGANITETTLKSAEEMLS